MNAPVRIAPEAHVIVPRDLAERCGWTPSTPLEVIETPQGLLVREQEAAKPGFDYDAFRRRVPRHEGPPMSLDDMDRGIDQAMRERWAEKEANSR